MRAWYVALSVILGAANLMGCASVTIISDNGPPQTELKFGVLAIYIAPSSDSVLVSSSGLGLVSTPAGMNLGYASAKVVRVGDACRVVIATNDLDAISKDPELARLLRATHKACAA